MKTLKSLTVGLVLSLTLSTDLLQPVSAQTASAAPKPSGTPTPPPGLRGPTSFYAMASASNKNHVYYQGGKLFSGNLTSVNELFSLDLTKTWPITSPPWVNLSVPKSGTGGPSVSSHSATMSKDGSTLLVTAPTDNQSPFLYKYNIAAGTWSTVNAPADQAALWSKRLDASFVTDSETGIAWLLGGSMADRTSTNAVDRFEADAWTPSVAVKPSSGGSTVMGSFNSGTAEIFKSRIYIFGGFSTSSGQRSYQSFGGIPWIDVSDPANPTYGTQMTMGTAPPSRHYHCSVLTESGRVIIYGGFDQNTQTALGDVWSLDLITMTWTRILATNGGSPRYGHNCDISGANMVVYGGLAKGATGGSVGHLDVQVYDVMLSMWMSSYAPKQDTTPPSTPLAVYDGSKDSGGIGIGAIIGIVAGVLVIIGVIFGIIFYQRRQKKIEIREAELEKQAYLASLRPEGEQGHPSPGPGRVSTPGMSHNGLYSGMDERLLQSAAASPGMGGQGQGNVQYLMQHLPDGTIAVQPVYLDHQPIQMQTSPNMAADSNYVSPPLPNASGGASPGSYFSPPPPSHSNGMTSSPSPAAANPYAMPVSQQSRSQVSFPHPTHDPFASPAMVHSPVPPGYVSSSVSGLGSPQQMHPQHNQQMR
ncbi:hypothetical protein BGZ70_008411 [Mortierella alpina]|uniref:Galactose oxidase n=1 Tax=Mortierella alpina TaxID=64518 RepID=A0A9P6JE29_MORAP|nr:hypothetical protein BGZ70_008411 [Mortierella alpina]